MKERVQKGSLKRDREGEERDVWSCQDGRSSLRLQTCPRVTYCTTLSRVAISSERAGRGGPSWCTGEYKLVQHPKSGVSSCMVVPRAFFPSLSLLCPCSEHGISRSVTVVLAYLMWSEHRPLKVLYLDLKERRPEIR